MNYKIYTQSKALDFANLIAGHLDMSVNYINCEQFADGELNVTFNESVRGVSLIIIASIEMPYQNIFELLMICDAARRSSAKEIILIIPYLIHSRQERRDDRRSPITARLLADMLQNAGADQIISMDIHTSAIEGFYNIPFDKLYPTEVFIEKIKSLNIENLVLVSPDAGFTKKMKIYVQALGCKMAIIDKTRSEPNKIDEMILIGDVKNANVVIIDDMIDTAKTLIKAADLVIKKGALSVIVFATHGVLSYKSEWDNAEYRLKKSKIKKVYITNTLYTYRPYNNNDDYKIQCIDVSKVFANAIQKIKNDN